MTSDCVQGLGSRREHFLEIAIPVIAFGCTLMGIFLWGAGLKIDFQYFAAGCVISSFLLAYLAWIRPRKDIVALSTPVYAIVFFVAPVDSVSGAILQLLYAGSLTILLIRLKYRFGSAIPPVCGLIPGEPLGVYLQRLTPDLLEIPEITARRAGQVFARFAEGDYDQARELALLPVETGSSSSLSALARAFSIVAEQSGQIIAGGVSPSDYLRFLPEHLPNLFHSKGSVEEHEYSLTLENALILLYAVAFKANSAELGQFLPFVRRLCGE